MYYRIWILPKAADILKLRTLSFPFIWRAFGVFIVGIVALEE
jgi:hypothetical protein